jgi:hypothetical protein
MRKIKASSSYLKNKTLTSLAKAALCVLIFGVLIFAVMYRSIYLMQIDTYALVGLAFLLVPVIAAYYYLRKYHLYNGGWQGEKQVTKQLSNSLSDDYYLINDLYLHGGGGDIDHIVLAPAGVFVLETKNWSGNISCNGDEWHRAGKRNFSSSPSRQVKRNAAKIKHIIDRSSSLRGFNIWVSGVVVLTNTHATVQLHNPTVPVLQLPQLTNYITTKGGTRRFSREQLEAIGKEIAKQKA